MDWVLRAVIAGPHATESTLQLTRRTIHRVRPDVMLHRLAQVRDVDARQELRKCTMPVLYLRGEADRVVRRSHLREIVENCPGVQVETIDAPHLLLQTCPCEAWMRICCFMGRTISTCKAAPD
jgi:pimeloyl-ACP methyl ester carboxylesterase